MGAVYKALDARLQRIVALKVLHSRLDDESAQRFITDLRVVARLLQLVRHPNMVGIFDFGKAEGVVYLVLEYIEIQPARSRELVFVCPVDRFLIAAKPQQSPDR